MAASLKLQVVMSMVDKALAPLRGIDRQAKATAQGLRQTRDTLKALERAQDDVGEFRKVRQALRGTATDMEAARAKAATLARQLAATETPTRAMQREFSKAQREAAALGGQHQQLAAKAQQLRDKLQAAGISARTLGADERELRQRIDATAQSITRQTAALKAKGDQQRRLAAIQEQQSKAAMRSAATMGAGFGGLAAGRMAGGAFADFMKGGVDFDATMSKVQALARLQKDSPQLAMLRQQAKDLGDSTMFSATEAAQGQAFLAMAGFKPEAIKAAMPGMLDMAKAGDMEIGRTADISSNILSAFGIDPSKMGNVADILTKTLTTSNVNLEMLGDTMSYVGPVARAAGVDLETTAAMAGLLGNVGIQGDKAGTAMRAMLLRLSAPTKGAAKQLKSLGVSTKDSLGNIKPIVPLLAEIAAKTEKLGSADRMAALKEIFGEEPAAAMTEIVSQAGSKGIMSYLKVVSDNQNAAAATAKTMADNMRGSLDELFSAWDTVGINVNETNGSWMRDTVDRLTDITRSVGGWVKENPALVKTLTMLAVVLAGAMTAFGVLAITLGLIVGKVMLVRFALQALGVQGGLLALVLRGLGAALRFAGTAAAGLLRLLVANPIVAAVAAIAVAAYLIYRHWGAISGFFAGLWQRVQAGAASAWEGVAGVIEAAWLALLATARSVWQQLGGSFPAVLAAIGAAIVNWSPLGLFYQAFAGVMGYFGIDMPQRFTEFGRNIVQGLANGIASTVGMVRDAIGTAADSAIGWFKEKLGIHSPSRVFLAAGINVGEGAALGIEGTQRMVRSAAGAMAAAAAVALPAPALAAPPPLPELVQRVALAAPAPLAPQLLQLAARLQAMAPPAPPQPAAPQATAAPAQAAGQGTARPLPAPALPAPAIAPPVLPALPDIVQRIVPGRPPQMPDMVQHIVAGTSPQVPDLVPRIAPPMLPAVPDIVQRIVAGTPPQVPDLVQRIAPPTLPALPDIVQRIVAGTPPQVPDLVQRLALAVPQAMPSPASGADGAPPALAQVQPQAPIDRRPPLLAPQAPRPAAPAPTAPAAGDRIEIHIHAAPGMDMQALAGMVKQQMERYEADKRARAGGGFYDLSN